MFSGKMPDYILVFLLLFMETGHWFIDENNNNNNSNNNNKADLIKPPF